MSDADDLLREADEQLEQDDDEDPKPGWGEQWKPDEGEHRLGRFLYQDSFRSFGETKIVYCFVDHPDPSTRFYIEWKTRLGKAMDEARPVKGRHRPDQTRPRQRCRAAEPDASLCGSDAQVRRPAAWRSTGPGRRW